MLTGSGRGLVKDRPRGRRRLFVAPAIAIGVVFWSLYVPAANLFEGLGGAKPSVWEIFWL